VHCAVSSSDQRMVIVRTVADWQKQALAAIDAICAANGDHMPDSLDAAAEIAPAAFASLIEAMVPLAPYTGRMPSAELIAKARLRPVDEVIL
jgi:hypothetical protein